MLKKENRLRTRYEFNKMRRFGKKNYTQLFNLIYLKPKNYEGVTRIGITVTVKLDKSAVKRNRVKRIYREVIRLNFDKIQAGYWILIYPNPASVGKDYEEINSEVIKLLQKLPISR